MDRPAGVRGKRRLDNEGFRGELRPLHVLTPIRSRYLGSTASAGDPKIHGHSQADGYSAASACAHTGRTRSRKAASALEV